MRFIQVISVTLAMSLGGSIGVNAQSLTAGDGPAETPPVSYTGKQYVDSQGCVFIRAGYDGNITWVPRVTRSREQLCGFAPTTTGAAVRKTPEIVETSAEVVGAEILASATVPTSVTNPVKSRAVPVAVRPAPLPSTFKVPRGFRVAWTDGRLNAKRGPRTAKGNVQMDMVWQNTVPRKLVETTVGASGGLSESQYVQVGAYGLTSNVDTVVAWLQRKHLPVGLSGSRRDGKNVQLVLAGPFGSQEKLEEVLAMTQRAGFSDAFIR